MNKSIVPLVPPSPISNNNDKFPVQIAGVPITVPSSPSKRAMTAKTMNSSTGSYFRPKEKQDLSGHVTFDSELLEFYRTSELRANKIERAFYSGTLSRPPHRNPIQAEKTPRRDFKGFDFNPPPMPEYLKPIEKWNYDNPISTNKLYSTLNRLSDRVQPETTAATTVPLQRDKNENVIVPTTSNLNPLQQLLIAKNSAATSSPRRPVTIQVQQQRRHINLEDIEGKLLDVSVTKFKKKVASDPILMAKWRAGHAAKFISEKRNSNDAPTFSQPEIRPLFLPSGYHSARRSYNKKPLPQRRLSVTLSSTNLSSITEKQAMTATTIDNMELVENLNMLRSKLNETQHEIERQELKLALMKGTKNYERPITARNK